MEGQTARGKRMLPLLCISFEPGGCRGAIDRLEDETERKLARAQYCRLMGRSDETLKHIRPLLDSEEPVVSMTAHILGCIAGLASGDFGAAHRVFTELESYDKGDGASATGAYWAAMLRVMFHLPERDPAILENIPAALPEGVRFFLCYVLALREHLSGSHGIAEGIARAALLMGGEAYPVSAIYLHIVSAAALLQLGKLKEADEHFRQAWGRARADGLHSPFSEHYTLLPGLNKKYLKGEFFDQYQEISAAADRFIPAWISVRNSYSDQKLSPELTKAERTVALLFSRGWRIKDISTHLNISSNTVKRHISATYQKLGVNSRSQLFERLLR